MSVYNNQGEARRITYALIRIDTRAEKREHYTLWVVDPPNIMAPGRSLMRHLGKYPLETDNPSGAYRQAICRACYECTV